MDLSSIKQIIRTKVPNASSDNVELYLDSVDRVLSRGGDYSDMSEDDVVEDFEYYIQSRMDEMKKPTTKMKRSEIKEMIKSAFMAENSMDDDAALKGMYGGDNLYEEEEAKEESLDDILARIMGTKADPYMAEDLYEAEEEEDIEIDTEEETEETEETEKPANDSIVVDKKIVSLSSLPSNTRKILDSLETLRAQAEEFGDQKFITQVGNTITFFTRDFVVAGDQPTKEKVDESLEIIRMRKLAGLLTEGEYAKALLRETKLFADFKAESKDNSEESKFARSMSETLHLLKFLKGKTNVENLTIDSLFEEGEMNSIQDGDEFYAGPGESLKFFQTLPDEFIIINNIDGDRESFKITKTGKNSFNAEKN